jgi:predicted DNA-binding protein
VSFPSAFLFLPYPSSGFAQSTANASRGTDQKRRLIALPILLTEFQRVSTLTIMEVRLKPETESRLNELASKSGPATDDLVEDAMAGYLAEVGEVRAMLDGRYDEIKRGQVKTIDGETFLGSLRLREDELLKQRRPK